MTPDLDCGEVATAQRARGEECDQEPVPKLASSLQGGAALRVISRGHQVDAAGKQGSGRDDPQSLVAD